jgi:hypothetical protein
VRTSNHHTWAGAGIPKLEEDGEHVRRAFISGLDVGVRAAEDRIVEVEVKNQRAGHNLPTGDVERFITVKMEVAGLTGVFAEKEERIGQVWEWSPEARRISDNRLAPREARVFRLAYPPEAATERDAKVRVTVTNHRMSEQTAKAQSLLGTYPTKHVVLRLEYPLISLSRSTP